MGIARQATTKANNKGVPLKRKTEQKPRNYTSMRGFLLSQWGAQDGRMCAARDYKDS